MLERKVLNGAMICFMWYYTIISGFYVLYCPIYFLAFICPKFYQKMVDLLFEIWMLWPVVLFQWYNGTEVIVHGDKIHKSEAAVLIMNYRTRVDWNFAWLLLHNSWTAAPIVKTPEVSNEVSEFFEEMPRINRDKRSFMDLFNWKNARLKLVIKDSVKSIPGIGWIMQLTNFLYVKRNWCEDHSNITQFLRINKVSGTPYQILIFPEGTDFTSESHRKSCEFAKKHCLEQYDFVLHPRTRGFGTITSELIKARDLKAVYDITVFYPDTIPQDETSLIRGDLPQGVCFAVKRYAVTSLPKYEEDLRTWLTERWKEKELQLKHFYNHELIKLNSTAISRGFKMDSLMIFSLIFWASVDATFIGLLLTQSRLFQFWICFHTCFMFVITKYCDGFHKLFQRHYLCK